MRETAPKVGHAVSDGARAAATHVREDTPKIGRAAADKATRIAAKLKRKNGGG